MRPQDKIHQARYLCLGGLLHPDNTLMLRPGFLVKSSESVREVPDGEILVELCDSSGKPLVHHRLSAGLLCGGNQPVAIRMIAGKIPFASQTKRIRLYRNQLLLEEIVVRDHQPELTWLWRPASEVSGSQRIEWKGSHAENADLSYFLRYSNDDGRTWRPISLMTSSSHEEIDFDRLPGGSRCKLMLTATDGVNTTELESAAFSVKIKACVATILSPANNTAFFEGEMIQFVGQGFYLEEDRAEKNELFWTSSQDGKLGQGSILSSAELSVGSHQITLRAGNQRPGEHSVTIHVNKCAVQDPPIKPPNGDPPDPAPVSSLN